LRQKNRHFALAVRDQDKSVPLFEFNFRTASQWLVEADATLRIAQRFSAGMTVE
jgi:hypothetical protein